MCDETKAGEPPQKKVVAEVIIDEPIVIVGSDYPGMPLIVSGQVVITSEATGRGFLVTSYATSTGYYSIIDPNGIVMSSNTVTITDIEFGLFNSNAVAGQIFNWSTTITPLIAGDYTITQGGSAEAWAIWLFGYNYANDKQQETTTHQVIQSKHSRLYPIAHDMLVIKLFGKYFYFFGSDGYGKGILTKDISASFRGFTITLKASTVITMDGEWQKQIWLVFNEDGSYTGAWGAPHGEEQIGHNRTTDVVLSIDPIITLH